MAETSFLHFLEHDQDLYLDEFSYWPHDRMMGPSPDFDLNDDLYDAENEVNFDPYLLGIDEIGSISVNESTLGVIERNHDLELELGLVDDNHDVIGSNTVNDSTFGVIEDNHDVGLDNLEVELGLVDQENDNHDVGFHGLGLELGLVDQEHDDNEDYNDWGDDFYIARKGENGIRNCDGSSSRVIGLRPVWIESDSDVEVEGIDKHNGDDDEEDYNFGGSIDSKKCENGSMSCDGSSSRVSRLRAIWSESDSDIEVEVEGIDSHKHENDGGPSLSNCENGSRSCDGSSSRVGGLRAILIESESDNEDEGIDDVLMAMRMYSDVEEDFGVDNMNDDVDISVPLCWDSFHLEEEEDHGGVNHDFDWEEVNDGVEEREVLNIMVDSENEEGSISALNFSGPEEDGEGWGRASHLEWEVLLNQVVNMERTQNMENEAGLYFGENDDFTKYEMLFGQFADGENANLGKPPASKAAIENLPSVVITKEDLIDEKSVCAVCKDQIEVGEEGKKLPCSHLYHGDCIIPWLGIRNTCPVCRFELPTDDPNYEQRRARRSTRVT